VSTKKTTTTDIEFLKADQMFALAVLLMASLCFVFIKIYDKQAGTEFPLSLASGVMGYLSNTSGKKNTKSTTSEDNEEEEEGKVEKGEG